MEMMKPSRFLAHGEQVGGWASSALLFFCYSHIMYIEKCEEASHNVPPPRKKVAAYARVSTVQDAQQNIFEQTILTGTSREYELAIILENQQSGRRLRIVKFENRSLDLS